MKINDNVVILRTDSDFLEQYIGSIGVVTRVLGNVYVQCVGGSCDGVWAFDERDLAQAKEVQR